ncbi:peptidylprolyl isomerase [Luteolibacter soli]|uniref:peptidylprolyl isomerase n=1 Tax=Luteolibacter soli TaxID=3135280 RepID=A0ABU9ANV4_9BACT
MKALLLLLLAFASLAHGQIYADFTVTQGSNPLGTFRARLDYDKAPRTCANFIGLATGRRPWIKTTTGQMMENTPFYNGLTFHRLVHNFVIQGGSPNGLGTDGPGYVVLDEFHPALRHSGRYFLSMAKGTSPNTGGSQFFITLAAAPSLDDKHSVFGEVIDGRPIIDGFTNATNFPVTNEKPNTPITMTNVVISGPSYAAFNLEDPALKLPTLRGTKMTPVRNAAASTFTLKFDRQPSHEYFNSYSMNLQSWTPFQYCTSCNALAAEEFTITSVTFPRFYMRMIDTDYGFQVNAPATLNQNGRKLRITSRAGDWVELTLGGSTTGTWTASNSTSGTLTGVSWTDSAPSAGLFTASNSQARLIPLGLLSATFSSPAGTGAWTSLNSAFLCFHSETGGWTEGNAGVSGGTIAVNQAFTITP